MLAFRQSLSDRLLKKKKITWLCRVFIAAHGLSLVAQRGAQASHHSAFSVAAPRLYA